MPVDFFTLAVYTQSHDSIRFGINACRHVMCHFGILQSRFIGEELARFNSIASCLSRSLNTQEKTLPPLRQLLLLRKILNEPDKSGLTPLLRAAKSSAKQAHTLIQLGADKDQKIYYTGTLKGGIRLERQRGLTAEDARRIYELL